MAGAGYKLFNTGDVLTAAQVNTYLQEQTVMVFASSTARTTALSGVLAEGMVSYLQDTNAVEVYNGSAWVGVSGAGDVTEVQAGTGISVASGTGPIPVVTNTMATEITAAGDIVVGTGSGTFDNLPIGTTGQVLTADTTVSPYKVKWAAAASGGLTLLQTNTLSGSAYTTASISQDYKQLRIVLRDVNSTGADSIFFRLNSDTGSNYYYGGLMIAQNAAFNYYDEEAATQSTLFYENMSGNSLGNAVVNIYRYTDTDRVFYDFATTSASTSFTPDLGRMTFTGCGIYDNSAAITTITIRTNTGNVGGTMYVYGVS